jgi:hypothetical protein
MNVVSLRDATLSRVRQPRQILLTLALALASTLAVTIAPPAHAQSQTQTEAQVQAVIGCPADRICLYLDINYGGGAPGIYATGSADMSRFGPHINDLTSSIWNNTTARWCAYEHANYRGLLLTIEPGPRRAIGYVGAAANDKISSLRRC